jgi:endonuclease G
MLSWVGTGWLVDKEVVITNRHVAKEFAAHNGLKFVFRHSGNNEMIGASIDFLEEDGRFEDLTFTIEQILHIENDNGPDLAFLKVKATGESNFPKQIILSSSVPEKEQDIAVIGYPARDSRIPDQQLMEDIFGDVYNKKKLAPGKITSVSDTQLLHDCSTLGGNSGSVVLDLKTGEAVGIHFAGRFLEANYAVPASVIGSRLKAIANGTINNQELILPTTAEAGKPPTKPPAIQQPSPSGAGGRSLQVTIPVTLTVSIGSLDMGSQVTSGTIATPTSGTEINVDEIFLSHKEILLTMKTE